MKKLLLICFTIASIHAMENNLPAALEKMKQKSPSAYKLWRAEVWTDEKIEQHNKVMRKVSKMLAALDETEANQQLPQKHTQA